MKRILAVAVLSIIFVGITVTYFMFSYIDISQSSHAVLSFGVYTRQTDAAYTQLVKKYQTNPKDIVSNYNGFGDYPNQRKVVFPASLDGLFKAIELGKTLPYKIDIIAYDPEHWNATPYDEQIDLVHSISKGADLIHNAGYKYGVAPDRVYLLENYQNIDWTKIDFVDLQLQRLAGNETFHDNVESISKVIRSENPNAEIFVQVSFRYSNATQIITSIESVKNLVDGVFIYYNPNGVIPCPNCTLDNLDKVLSTIK